MGVSWFLFRLKYEFLKRTQYFNKKNNDILLKLNQLNLDKSDIKPFGIVNKAYKSNATIEKAEKALLGEIFSFSSQYFDYSDENKEINWHKNPVINKVASSNKPWNNLPDFGVYGDIKCIWEASRFPQVFFFVDAYSISKDEKYAYACINQIVHWIESNPYPQGVNYKCGQEIAFRLFAWIIACDYFSNFISKDKWLMIRKAIYVSLCRIDLNIDYAAKSVRNNHSISEAVGLLVGGLLFPEFPESQHFKKKGLEYLCHEVAYQVYDDGTYIQHSFNYQRLAMDVLSYAILIMKNKNTEVPNSILEAHKKLYKCLNSFRQENGYLPNYGSNDGAYLFPVGNYDYRDYRQSLNFASAVNQGVLFFDSSKNIVNLFNLTYSKKAISVAKNVSFDVGGYYILKNDVLHMDIWIDGENVFSDAGSYSYNTDKNIKKQFIGMTGHNTFIVRDTDPMPTVLNFGYTNWVKSRVVKFLENEIICQHEGYKKKFGVIHQRYITLNEKEIVITDSLLNQEKTLKVSQVWNSTLPIQINQDSVEINNRIKMNTGNKTKRVKYLFSNYYNSYTEHDKILAETLLNKNEYIQTRIEIN